MDVKKFLADRDAVLLDGDVDACVAFLLAHNPGMAPPSSYEVAEMMMHKARTGAMTLPVAARRYSKHWLMRRGYASFDDGDL